MITLGTSTLSRFQRGALAQLVSEGHHTYQDMADALGVAKLNLATTRCYLNLKNQLTNTNF